MTVSRRCPREFVHLSPEQSVSLNRRALRPLPADCQLLPRARDGGFCRVASCHGASQLPSSGLGGLNHQPTKGQTRPSSHWSLEQQSCKPGHSVVVNFQAYSWLVWAGLASLGGRICCRHLATCTAIQLATIGRLPLSAAAHPRRRPIRRRHCPYGQLRPTAMTQPKAALLLIMTWWLILARFWLAPWKVPAAEFEQKESAGFSTRNEPLPCHSW